MATQVSVHWLGYGFLTCTLGLGAYLWHQTKIDDAKTAAAVSLAISTQKSVDQTAISNAQEALKNVASKNAVLESNLAKAKTVPQKIEVVNGGAGTDIKPVPLATNPSQPEPLPDAPVAQISKDDLDKLAIQTVALRECQNQASAVQVQIASQKQQLDARDKTISDQAAEIKAAKGSRMHRFVTGLKTFAIGFAAGTLNGMVIEKQIQ